MIANLSTAPVKCSHCTLWKADNFHLIEAIVTAGTVVQAVVKANSQSNGNGQISTPRGSETPERIWMKLEVYNYVGGVTTHANAYGAATTCVVSANTWLVTCLGFLVYLFVVALWNRANHYIFCPVVSIFLFLSSFFPRLISVAADWMSTILRHMMWPYCEFRIQVWNVLQAARCKYRTQKWCKKIAIWAPSHNFVGLCLRN